MTSIQFELMKGIVLAIKEKLAIRYDTIFDPVKENLNYDSSIVT